jgi:hypothetical protein
MNATQKPNDNIDPIFNSLTRYNAEHPRAREGFNYGAGVGAYHLGEPCGDDSRVNAENIAGDKDDFIDFRREQLAPRDTAQESDVSIPHKDLSNNGGDTLRDR